MTPSLKSPMKDESLKPVVLQAPVHQEKTWIYPWIGVLFGVLLGIFVAHPLSMLVYNFYAHVTGGKPIDASGAIFHSFHWHMWPMMAIFSLFGAVVWGFIGLILQRLRESRLRLNALNHEFEIQASIKYMESENAWRRWRNRGGKPERT